MSFVYILTSIVDPRRIYIGLTDNLEERVKEHNQEKSVYSGRYAPWHLETYISFSNKKYAASFERYLKSGSGHAFLKKRFLPK